MRRIAGVLVCALLLTGCGGAAPHSPTDAGRAPSSSQLLELARVLLGDYQHSGSRIAGTYRVQGQLLEFSGTIDFRRDQGTLWLIEARQAPRRFYWTSKLVLAQVAPGSPNYLAERPDPQRKVVDHLIAFLGLLSSPAIDNLELLQTSGVRYLGSADGLDRFREGARTMLFVSHATGLLSEAQVNEASGGKITVMLLDHGPKRIALPPRSSWRTESGAR